MTDSKSKPATRGESRPIEPLAPPIYLASVYRCHDPDEAAALLAGEREGYIYRRDGHPNADQLAERCRLLHGAEQAAICGSGMSAMVAALLATCAQGDHVVASSRLYGRTLQLLSSEAARLGITCTTVDTCDLAATRSAVTSRTKLIVVETITNPTLRVSDLAALAEIAHSVEAQLLADNSLASPFVCRPLEQGVDLALESLTKIMNGHSDVLLGLLCGNEGPAWERLPTVLSAWGLNAAPFDCWLAARGMETFALRAERAGQNALQMAEYLAARTDKIAGVEYPGLASHVDHALARRQFGERFGSLVTFHLAGDSAAARQFIRAAEQIPFAPSLGELNTTLSHPESTSHRTLSAAARQSLGITGGTIRLSVGIEPIEAILAALDQGLAGV
ncbi:MAG: aminotransferase class I/II-fold pyridoxal phosphate-dependent enzyme [Pirellulales bacterium]|nr:aminotransferase class I/II-fold pyridoxal phosphate-dependent enzyme [Pirellulales bacterium]